MITVENMVKVMYDAIDDKLGQDIAILNIGKAIADSVEDAMTELGIEPRGKEGREMQNWILLDYGDVMVHVFDEENRGFYNLEKLWKDAPYLDPEIL